MKQNDWKKLYSHYRQVIRNFNERMANSDWPCGYDDMMGENMRDHTKRHLEANPIIKKVLDNLDRFDYQFGYNAETEDFKNYRYQNAFTLDGKIIWNNK